MNASWQVLLKTKYLEPVYEEYLRALEGRPFEPVMYEDVLHTMDCGIRLKHTSFDTSGHAPGINWHPSVVAPDGAWQVEYYDYMGEFKYISDAQWAPIDLAARMLYKLEWYYIFRPARGYLHACDPLQYSWAKRKLIRYALWHACLRQLFHRRFQTAQRQPSIKRGEQSTLKRAAADMESSVCGSGDIATTSIGAKRIRVVNVHCV